jgi:uncharacterized membrane protein YwaF
VHGVAVLLSIAGWAALLALARATERRRGARGARAFRRGFGLFVAAFNLACFVRLLMPDVFDWGHSLPLHLCDLAWGAAVLSLLSGGSPSLVRHQAPVDWFGPWPLRILWIALAGGGALWLVATLLMRWGARGREAQETNIASP